MGHYAPVSFRLPADWGPPFSDIGRLLPCPMKRLAVLSAVRRNSTARAAVTGMKFPIGEVPWRPPFPGDRSADPVGRSDLLWTADFPGSTPVTPAASYINGYTGEGASLQECVRCDAATGEHLNIGDLISSDTIYLRYSTSSPTIDAETGNVYVQFTQGVFCRLYSRRESPLETFHDGGVRRPRFRIPAPPSPVVDADLVITCGITAPGAPTVPPETGSTPSTKKRGIWSGAPLPDRPQDNTFSNSHPRFLNGKRVLYSSAGGDSSILALNACTELCGALPSLKLALRAVSTRPSFGTPRTR